MKRLLRVMGAVGKESVRLSEDTVVDMAQAAAEEFIDLGYHKNRMPSENMIRIYLKNNGVKPEDMVKGVKLAKKNIAGLSSEFDDDD